MQKSFPLEPLKFRTELFPRSPLEYQKQQFKKVKKDIDKRWAHFKKNKSKFALYTSKNDSEIIKEFEILRYLRESLWYRDPLNPVRISQPDYLMAQEIIRQGEFSVIQNIPFAYNLTDPSYNASTIIIEGYHFIALQNPTENTVNLFYKLLINQGASILVRLLNEYDIQKPMVAYWKNNIDTRGSYPNLTIAVKEVLGQIDPVQMPYIYTDDWHDNRGIEVAELYRLVQTARSNYHILKNKGPIACHCASGVGRTGTFIAAFVLAELLDHKNIKDISIEEIAAKLSIQRPNLLGTSAQYLTLHKFVEYYMKNHKKLVKS